MKSRESTGGLLPEPGNSLIQAAERLAHATRQVLASAKTEEDLRIGFEKLLEPLLTSIGVAAHPEYERAITNVGRADAIHGPVIIEYEAPRAFRSQSAIAHAYAQLVGYMKGEAERRKDALFLFDPKVVGVGFDGERAFFVRYRGEKSRPKTELKKRDFTLLGPYMFGPETARTLLAWMRASSRRLLTADELTEAFGPGTTVAKSLVSALVDALKNWDAAPRVRAFFEEWQRLFGIIYGEHFGARREADVTQLCHRYGVDRRMDLQEMLFAIHTYFALLMKLIAAELLAVETTSFKSSFSEDLAHSSSKDLLAKLRDVEDGGVYARRGITNFLEGDFFRWYLDAPSPRLDDAIRELARALSEFEPATTTIAPGYHRDLLKKLYQYLVPQQIRHDLGEYYTPDWLAELVLQQINYRGDSRKRLLDPACGSGTFLVLAIQKARERARKNKESTLQVAKRTVANIWGFDLNPLAVIAARTNYLFAMGDLVNELEEFELPVYLADSVLWPPKAGQLQLDLSGGEHVSIPTSVGEFHVPAIWVKQNGFRMKRAAPIVQQMVKNGYGAKEAVERLQNEGLVFPPHERVVESFYQHLRQLEEQRKNGIWARFLKNVFAPMAAGKFDYVAGNPPWIRWGYLSAEYRNATVQMWKDYGLFSLKGPASRLGGGEKDFSMLFMYASADFYLRKGGTLGFLITQEVFKSKGAGEGFRRFRLNDKMPLRVLKAHDLVPVKPFEGAANKTAMIVLRKGTATRYPVPYTLWERKKKVGRIPTDLPLADAKRLLKRTRLEARPIGNKTGAWQTVPKGVGNLAKISGRNAYKARLGARVEPYGVFWLQINQVLSQGLILVSNMPERGKREVPEVQHAKIEADLVFPAVGGADIERWGATPGVYVLMVQDPDTSKPFPESVMKQKWPRTYDYLTQFKEVLLTRGSKTVRQFAERTSFYAMFGIGPYTVAPYRVVWKRMASDLTAAVISEVKTPFGFKKVIATDTTSLIACTRKEEAHYLCGILNAKPVRDFIKSYSSPGRGFGAPSVMQNVGIPKFDTKSKLHLRLAEVSEELHRLKSKDALDNVAELEQQLRPLVSELFGADQQKG